VWIDRRFSDNEHGYVQRKRVDSLAVPRAKRSLGLMSWFYFLAAFLVAAFLVEVFFAAFLVVGFAVTAFAFFTAFLAATGFDSDALEVAGLAFFLPPKMESHPLAYFSLVPTRVIVTVLPQIQNIVNKRRT